VENIKKIQNIDDISTEKKVNDMKRRFFDKDLVVNDFSQISSIVDDIEVK